MVDDGEQAPSPEETLRLIEEQRAATVRRFRGDPLFLYVPWGVAWLIGFTCLFLRYGLDGRPYAPISQTQAVAVLMICMVIAGSLAAYEITRMNMGVRGESTARGTMYGYTWFAGMVVMSIIAIRVSPMLPEAEAGLLWSGVSMLVVGVMYMAGGAIFLYWPMFFAGVGVIAVNGLGVLLGPGWHALLTAILLGFGQIVVGLWWRRRQCR
ncbi:hypothetical protein ACQP2T_37045 [Nonomuraea sp. CA-143628]|uniref:hypothetical protein n=1 Tax=Nonomuraea sp. CA-143628 TaxID=3239997 RepID=UPI003D8E9BDD